MRTLPQIQRKYNSLTLSYSQRNRVGRKVKLVAPVAMTQRERKRKKRQAVARQCNASHCFMSHPLPHPLRVLFSGMEKNTHTKTA